MKNIRLGSIDVFRAITMLLMVFVNSLYTVQGVPQWLEHSAAEADDMGFSDVIFPAFLFIVGLSLPLALQNRLSRGESRLSVFTHVVLRSVALIVMGFFHVNMENYSNLSPLPRMAWIIIVTIAFFLVWLDYKNERLKKWKTPLQIGGIIILIMMAVLYKGNSSSGETIWMTTQWWGILGLIGWAYLLCASIVLFGKEKMSVIISALLFFLIFNVASHSGWIDFLSPVTKYGILDLGNASNSFLVMSGVLISVLYAGNSSFSKKAIWFILIVAALFLFGFITRPEWGISKIRATPSWIAICAGISIVFFLLLIYVVDVKNKKNWFNIIKPAGTSTLTCYLLPYLYQAIIISIIGIRLPLYLRTGGIGIIKCLLFALLIVLITGWLEKRKIRLKI